MLIQPRNISTIKLLELLLNVGNHLDQREFQQSVSEESVQLHSELFLICVNGIDTTRRVKAGHFYIEKN